MLNRLAKTTILPIVVLLATVLLSGCSIGNFLPFGGASERVDVTTQSYIDIAVGAENTLANGSVKMTVLNMERRPVSTFQDANGLTSAGGVGSSNDIVVQIDLRYTYNANTLSSVTSQAGGSISSLPSTLGDILMPGSLMYIQGTDQNGEAYVSATVLRPSSTGDSSRLGVNAQWDYDLLFSQLPQATEEKNGSILFQVSSTARDLQLVIITPDANANPFDANSVSNGNSRIYVLDLT